MIKRALHLAILAAGNYSDPADKSIIHPIPLCLDELSFTRSREGYIEVIEIDDGAGTEVFDFNLYLSPFDHWRI